MEAFISTVEPVLSSHTKIVERILGLEKKYFFFVFLRVAVLHSFDCIEMVNLILNIFSVLNA